VIDEPALLAGIYAGLNGIALLMFAIDKLQARQNGWRIRETTLLELAFFGPFGALGGMVLFRHKTQKLRFWLVPACALLHGILLAIFLPGLF
jgi:uncharacterized membrane protein YsdA (DUF1294 family)